VNASGSQRGRKKPVAEINVVPYIDVMLVLLVIFMITAPMFAQGIKVSLPEVSAEAIESESDTPLVLTVDLSGQLFINQNPDPQQAMSDDAVVKLTQAILLKKPNTPVLVEGDQGIEYGKIVSAMVLLQSAGAKSIGLVTETPEDSRSQ
jgi:biopolymer transport protein TolR